MKKGPQPDKLRARLKGTQRMKRRPVIEITRDSAELKAIIAKRRIGREQKKKAMAKQKWLVRIIKSEVNSRNEEVSLFFRRILRLHITYCAIMQFEQRLQLGSGCSTHLESYSSTLLGIYRELFKLKRPIEQNVKTLLESEGGKRILGKVSQLEGFKVIVT